MSEHGMKPTDASEIALPVEVVELKHLRTKDGGPVFVRCEAVDELVAMETQGLPGEHAFGIPVEKLSAEEKRERAKRNVAAAAPLVHHGTSFVNGDAVVRPAFHYDEAHAVPGSVAWRYVSMEDKFSIINTITRLSGYGGADDARFPGRK